MTDYDRLRDYLEDAKADFDRRVTRNPAYTQADKLAHWLQFTTRMLPTVVKLQKAKEDAVYQEVMQEAQAFAHLLQHKKVGAA